MSDALRAAEKRIAEHPGYQEHLRLEALGRSLADVFGPNLRELEGLLEAAAMNTELAFELIQNVREPVVRDKFHGVLSQRLHNYLASAQSLVDHVRRVMHGRSGPLVDEFDRRKSKVIANPEVRFVTGLRNYLLHRALPGFAHTLSVTGVNTREQKMESEVQLDVAELQSWDRWSTADRAFMNQYESGIPIRLIIRTHGRLHFELNSWLYAELGKANDAPLAEVNQLIVERNTILAGGDAEEGQRMSRYETRFTDAEE